MFISDRLRVNHSAALFKVLILFVNFDSSVEGVDIKRQLDKTGNNNMTVADEVISSANFLANNHKGKQLGSQTGETENIICKTQNRYPYFFYRFFPFSCFNLVHIIIIMQLYLDSRRAA